MVLLFGYKDMEFIRREKMKQHLLTIFNHLAVNFFRFA